MSALVDRTPRDQITLTGGGYEVVPDLIARRILNGWVITASGVERYVATPEEAIGLISKVAGEIVSRYEEEVEEA